MDCAYRYRWRSVEKEALCVCSVSRLGPSIFSASVSSEFSLPSAAVGASTSMLGLDIEDPMEEFRLLRPLKQRGEEEKDKAGEERRNGHHEKETEKIPSSPSLIFFV